MENLMRDAYKPELAYLGIGLGGVYGAGISNPSTKPIFGTETAFSVSIPDTRLTPYFGDLIHNGWVIDKRPVPEKDMIHWVVSGPMLNICLPRRTIKRSFSSSEEVMPTDQSWMERVKSFDYISMDLYIDLWSKLGAKIGQRSGDAILWVDGSRTEIPKAEDRYSCREDYK
jgi:hypothetical protein